MNKNNGKMIPLKKLEGKRGPISEILGIPDKECIDAMMTLKDNPEEFEQFIKDFDVTLTDVIAMLWETGLPEGGRDLYPGRAYDDKRDACTPYKAQFRATGTADHFRNESTERRRQTSDR